MSVVTSSVIILFALIFLGFFIGKRAIVRQDCCPDLSNLILKVTMPVTVFCSMIRPLNQPLMLEGVHTIIAVAVYHGVAFLIGVAAVRIMRVPDREKGVWLFTCMLSNNGFMGLPLALSIYGNDGMFVMAFANIMTNLLIFSVGVKLMTRYYPVKEKISLKKMLVNNINIAVVVGLIFYFMQIPIPEVISELLGYIADITSGLSMIVVGLSLSRMPFQGIFRNKRMFVLVALRLIVIPLIVIWAVKVLPFDLGELGTSVLVLTATLPAASSQSMLCEQYGTNTQDAGRAVILTTLCSVITVPLMVSLAFG